MRKTNLILVPVLAICLGLAAVPASAYQFELRRVYVTSYAGSGASQADAPRQGYYDLLIEGEWPRGLKGTLKQGRETVAAGFALAADNCREGRTRPRGRFERSRRAEGFVRLAVTAHLDVPGERGGRVCDLLADVPFTPQNQPQQGRPNPGGPGQGGIEPAPEGPGSVTTPPKPPQHGRPNPGGPGQGGPFAPELLPNLRIRTAKAIGGRSATQLSVVVVNTGNGASAKTALLMGYSKDGVIAKASSLVPPLAAGKATTVQVGTGNLLSEADSVTLRVDDPDVVSESNEADNGYAYAN